MFLVRKGGQAFSGYEAFDALADALQYASAVPTCAFCEDGIPTNTRDRALFIATVGSMTYVTATGAGPCALLMAGRLDGQNV